MPKQILIFDTTLRDGEQSPGVSLDINAKLKIALELEALGVNIIEAGFAAISPSERNAIQVITQSIRSCQIACLARTVKSDIDEAFKALEGTYFPRIHLFTPTSQILREYQTRVSQEKLLSNIYTSISYAKSQCTDIQWSPMDATRTEIDFLESSIRIAIEAGATTINIPDTVGYSTPQEFYKLINHLRKIFPSIKLSVHCHNDLGLATANTLSGILAGADQAECTINGIGERAGNAALEEVAMAMVIRPDIYPKSSINTPKLVKVSKLVSKLTGMKVQKNKAIVGANAFVHESGIHQDGLIKNVNSYQIIDPLKVGKRKTKLLLGKHSGSAGLREKCKELGLILNEENIKEVLTEIRNFSESGKKLDDKAIKTMIIDKLKKLS